MIRSRDALFSRLLISSVLIPFSPLLVLPPCFRKQQTASERTGALPVQKVLAPRALVPSRCVAMVLGKAAPVVSPLRFRVSLLPWHTAGSLNTPRTLDLTRFLRRQRRAASDAMGECAETPPIFRLVRIYCSQMLLLFSPKFAGEQTKARVLSVRNK